MISWIQNNIATILISAVLVAIVAAIIAKTVRDEKNGKSSCGNNCAHCAMQGKCHTYPKEKKGKTEK